QLRLYALLWHRDRDLNPEQRLANRLSLIYPDGIEEVVPPSITELAQIESELGSRALAARDSLIDSPPEARVSREGCTLCSVRQSCSSFWEPANQALLATGTPAEALGDAEVRITGRAGE